MQRCFILDLPQKQAIWLNSGLLAQFTSTWKMLRKAIENVPDKHWFRTENDWSYSKTVYHILETQEFYIRNSPEGMVWNKLLEPKGRENKAKDYPTKEQLENYLKEIEEKVSTYLKTLSFEQLLEKDGFKWFSSIFEKLLYLLRHTAHHLGELGRMLREWDCKRMKWQ